MKKSNFICKATLVVIAATTAFALSGCSTAEDNPVSAQDMQEIRRQEANERANFNPESRTASPNNGR